MKINQTKCDHCGKVINCVATVPAHLTLPDDKSIYDFCNEDCLREFLINRNYSPGVFIDGHWDIKRTALLLSSMEADDLENMVSVSAHKGSVRFAWRRGIPAGLAAGESVEVPDGDLWHIDESVSAKPSENLQQKAMENSQSADIKLMVEALKYMRRILAGGTVHYDFLAEVDIALATPTAKKVG